MATPAELFDQGWKHHQAGDLAQAERLYRQVLAADSHHADAWCFLGAVCQAQAKRAEAEVSYRRAIQISPGYASALNSLGVLLAEQGQLDEAAANFLQVLLHHPSDADAHNNLGLVRTRQGMVDLAIACYERALQLQPDYGAARTNLDLVPRHRPVRAADVLQAVHDANQRGVDLAQQGRLEEGKIFFHQALRHRPDDADAHNNLSSALILQDRHEEALADCLEALRVRPDFVQALHNLGTIREHQLRLDEAAQSFTSALRLLPTYAEAWYSLANTRKRQNKTDEALAHYREAIRLKPDFADAYNNLAALLCARGDIGEAEKHYRHALRLRPGYVAAHNNLGVLLRDQGNFAEALTQFDHAIALQPDFAEVRWNRALVWLLQGDYQRGWPEFDWRWRQRDYYWRNFPQPLWDGSPLDGRTILLHAEQGFGDTLQCIRYVEVVKQRGGQVIVECQPKLQRILRGVTGIEQLFTWGDALPEFDVHAPLLCLPGMCRTTLANIPAVVPYLDAEADLVERWRQELASLQGFKIGIAWQGNPSYGLDRLRSIPLTQFAPLAKVDGVQLISLQKGVGTEQLAAVAGQFAVVDLGDRMDEAAGAFVDTAAIMKNLDLVICSDSAVAHLAGALGVPVWLALAHVPDWRWLLDRDDSPWYPTMRLFRQTRFGKWEEVFQRLADAVKTLAASQDFRSA